MEAIDGGFEELIHNKDRHVQILVTPGPDPLVAAKQSRKDP